MDSTTHLTLPQCSVKHIPWKRIFDIGFSLFALILCLPLFVLIAIGIVLSSRGNIVFSQERIGRGGKKFHCYKFRSMYSDAEKRLTHLLASDHNLRSEWEKHHKLKNDPRITPFGRFLRKTSLDELPQFFNVLKGDLSVVGPRPVVENELVSHYGPKASKILSIRPGVTGIWQVSGRNDLSYSRRIEMDEKYVDTHSLLLDLSLIIKTIPRMIFSKGAY